VLVSPCQPHFAANAAQSCLGSFSGVSECVVDRAGNELCERLAYYGLVTNMVTYLTRVMGSEPANAAVMVSMGFPAY
jgi:hypothetical protein